MATPLLISDAHSPRASAYQERVKVGRQAAGLEDPFEKYLARPLARHMKGFVNYLRNKGNTECYARHTAQRLNSAIGACRFAKISGTSASRFPAFLRDAKPLDSA